MMLPYSWFSITMTKTCENAGTPAGGDVAGFGVGVAGAGLPAADGVAAVGDGIADGVTWGVGVGNPERCVRRSFRSLKSAAASRLLVVGLIGGLLPRFASTNAVGMASSRPAIRISTAPLGARNFMIRLTRSLHANLRIARSVTQRLGESICHPCTL